MGEFGNNPYNIDMPVGTDGKMDPDAKLNYWGDWRNALLKSRSASGIYDRLQW